MLPELFAIDAKRAATDEASAALDQAVEEVKAADPPVEGFALVAYRRNGPRLVSAMVRWFTADAIHTFALPEMARMELERSINDGRQDGWSNE